MKVRYGVIALVLMSGGVILAQQATQTAPTETAAPATAAAEADPAAEASPDLESLLESAVDTDSYTYDPQGRRDPFRSLIGRTRVLRDGTAAGVSSFLVEEIDVQGVLRTREGYIAMITGPDNNGYSLRVGDKVFDGEVVRITPSSVVFRQETREVVRELAPRGARQN